MKALSKNILSIFVSDILRRLLGFLCVAYIARTLGASGLGTISIAFTVFSYALMVSCSGYTTLGVREIASGASAKFINNILSLRFLTSLIVFFIVAILSLVFIQNTITASLIILLCISLFPNAFFLDWYFWGKERLVANNIGKTLSAAIYFVLLILFIHDQNDILWVAIAALVGDTFLALFLLFIYRKELPFPKLEFDIQSFQTYFKKAFSLGSGSILAHVSINFPILAIGLILTNSDVGIYTAANKLIFFLLMFDRLIASILLPAAARLQITSQEILSERLNEAIKWILIAGLPLTIGGFLVADDIIFIVFKEQFIEAVPIFQILLLYFLLTMLHTVYTSILIVNRQEKIYNKLMVISAAIYCSLIISFILMFGIIGAAIAVVCSEAIAIVLMRNYSRKFTRISMPANLLNITTSAVIMGFVITVINLPHFIIKILFGALVYCIMLFVLRGINLIDIKNLLKRF